MPTVLIARKPSSGRAFPLDCLLVVGAPLIAAVTLLAWQTWAIEVGQGWAALSETMLSLQAIP